MAISLAPAVAAPPADSRAASGPRLEIEIDHLRSGKGLVQLCLTSSPSHFPDCRGDPGARKLSVPAASARLVVIPDLAPGTYALTLLHDENGNGRMDKMMGIPKEGFGFSRNPVIRFGPPQFDQVRFRAGEGPNRQNVTMKYLL